MKVSEIKKQQTSDGSELKPRQGQRRKKISSGKHKIIRSKRKPPPRANIVETDTVEDDLRNIEEERLQPS